MRRRPSNPEVVHIMKIKEENAKRIICLSREVKTLPWTSEELHKVLKSLKNNKCRDPNGMINELFRPGVIGSDLQIALLDLFNLCKTRMQIPEFLKTSNIVNVWKKKGDKMDIDSYRGIFVTNIFKAVLLKLIHQDKSKIIDSHMTDFQIGGRKGKNVRDHLFVINGIAQDALSSVKSKPINLIVADFQLCFDGLSLPLTCKDLYSSGCKDDKLSLLYEINKTSNVAVKTSLGLTDRFEIEDNVLQGDVFGNILASNQIDKFGKKCLEDDQHLYLYTNTIPIAPMTMCDDLLVVSECGYTTELAVSYINSQSRYNYLQFGLTKCSKLHIGKTKQKFKCSPIYLDSWTSKEKENEDTGQISFEEKYSGKMKVAEVSEVKYLGNILSSDGSNIKDISMKCNRGVGTINKIQNILETMFFGPYYFEIGITLIESMLLGSILTNIEVAYNLTISETEKLEKCHEMALRKLLNLPSKTPKQMLYFLTGSTPIRITVKRRRLVYLHHILNQNE